MKRLMLTLTAGITLISAWSAPAAPPATHAFTGGDYWVMRMALRRGLLRDAGGAIIPPGTYSEDQWALVRAHTTVLAGWGFKFQFTAPDRRSGAGTATIVADGMEHRHRVDQSFCTDCGVHAGGSLGMVVDYTLARDGRLRLAFTDAAGTNIVQGAFSRDFNLFAIAVTAGPDMGKDLIVGVRAAGAPLSVSGLLAGTGYGVDIDFRFDLATPDPNDTGPKASHLGLGADIGWIELSAAPGNTDLSSHVSIADPATPGAFANAGAHATARAPTMSSITTGPDGVFTLSSGGGFWGAVAPDGQTVIGAGDTNDTDPDFTTLEFQRHHLGNGVFLKQDPTSPPTLRDLRGTYAIIGRFDELRILAPAPVSDCHPGPDVIAGTESCGTSLRQTQAVSVGQAIITATGGVSFSVTDYHDTETTSMDTGTASLAIERRCFGLGLPFSDPLCAGGRLLDVGVLRDAAGEFALLLIGDGGEVLSFFDPKGINGTSGVAGLTRSLGYALRLR